MQYAMPFLNFLLSWCCLTHFCKWKKNILVTEQNPDSKSCYLVHNKHQLTAPIWPLVDDSCRLPCIPLLVESLWRVFFLGACPGNDKRYCNQLANNSITLVWGDFSVGLPLSDFRCQCAVNISSLVIEYTGELGLTRVLLNIFIAEFRETISWSIGRKDDGCIKKEKNSLDM